MLYVHVIGTEIDWPELSLRLAGSGRDWQGAVFFDAHDALTGSLVPAQARARLKELEAAIEADRLHINAGQFFDCWGRRMRLEAAD